MHEFIVSMHAKHRLDALSGERRTLREEGEEQGTFTVQSSTVPSYISSQKVGDAVSELAKSTGV